MKSDRKKSDFFYLKNKIKKSCKKVWIIEKEFIPLQSKINKVP